MHMWCIKHPFPKMVRTQFKIFVKDRLWSNPPKTIMWVSVLIVWEGFHGLRSYRLFLGWRLAPQSSCNGPGAYPLAAICKAERTYPIIISAPLGRSMEIRTPSGDHWVSCVWCMLTFHEFFEVFGSSLVLGWIYAASTASGIDKTCFSAYYRG